MKHQRKIHLGSVVFKTVGVVIAWHWLPPYLVHNPGVVILAVTVILADLGHFIFHGK